MERMEEILNGKNWNEIIDSMEKRKRDSCIQSIESLLDAGLDVNTLNKYGTTLLSYATECGNLEVARFLVKKGADANVANFDGSKPLHIAAHYFHKDILKYFLSLGISADSYDSYKSTALHYVVAKSETSSAGRDSSQELIHILVDHYADLNAVDREGCSPMILAAKRSRKHIVELFIKLGANLESCDEDRWSVLHFACREGWSGTVRTLVEGRFDIDLNAITSQGKTPAIIAAEFSHEGIVKLLIESGADVECKYLKFKLLHSVCRNGWLDVVKLLVNKGADINAKDCEGYTPWLWAVILSNVSVIEYLIECGADVTSCRSNGWTLLHFACCNGWFEVVKSLVSKGADVNAKCDEGETPLHYAAYQLTAHYRIIEYLIEKGAYFQKKDYTAMGEKNSLKTSLLQNTQLCTLAVINKYNNFDLHKFSEIPRERLLQVSKRLPHFEKLKIASMHNVAHGIAESVEHEIKNNGFCNVVNVNPIVLQRLCVLTLVKHYS